MLRRFFKLFILLSTIGLLFFRPLIFKREIKFDIKGSEIDSVYYYHGFPISSLVKDKPSSNEKIRNYKVVIYPIKPEILIGRIESDVDFINLRTFNLPDGWEKIDGNKFRVRWRWKLYLWTKFSDINKPNPIEFNIKARDYIRILVGSGINGGTFKIKIDTIEKIIDTYDTTISIYPKWHYINLNNIISISPESKEVILKFKDKVSNLEIKGYEYELIDSNKVLIKNLKVDYFKVFLNSLLVIIYAFILSIILTFSNSLFLRYFSIIFTILLIYLLAYFPGYYWLDSWVSILEALGIIEKNDISPPLYTLITFIILKIFGNLKFYVLIQILLTSILFAWILNKLKVIKLEWYLILVFVFPISSLMLINSVKDIYYTLSLIWFSFLLYFAYQDKNYLKSNLNLLAFIISMSFVMLFRYNGIGVVIIVGILMIFLFREYLKRVLIILMSVLLIFLVFNIFYYYVLKSERWGVAYQKDIFIISEYVKNNYPFSKSEREIIEKIISYDDIKKHYTCITLSSMAWSRTTNFEWDNLNKYGKDIRKILIKTIINDPKPFIRHMICSSSFLWFFGSCKVITSFDYIYHELPSIKLFVDIKLPQIKKIIEKLSSGIKNRLYFSRSSSLYNYALLVVFILIPKLRILIFPFILNTITLTLFAPDNDFRYVFPSFLMFIMIYPVLLSKIQKNSKLL
jgi:hypothetical protein